MQNSSYSVMLAKIQAHRHTEEIIKKSLDEFDVTIREWLFLGSLKLHNQDSTSGVIAKEIHVSSALISRLTKVLQAKGMIKVVQPEDDKRSRRITLTDKGNKVIEQSDPVVRRTLREWLAPIKREHVDIYIDVLLQVAYKL